MDVIYKIGFLTFLFGFVEEKLSGVFLVIQHDPMRLSSNKENSMFWRRKQKF